MPRSEVIFYKARDGTVPMQEWLKSLPTKSRDKCVFKLGLLKEFGHELRRPHADYLRDGIYELRVKHGRVNHRILYFFFGGSAVVISHGLIKEDRVPAADIESALDRKRSFQEEPEQHMFIWEGEL